MATHEIDTTFPLLKDNGTHDKWLVEIANDGGHLVYFRRDSDWGRNFLTTNTMAVYPNVIFRPEDEPKPITPPEPPIAPVGDKLANFKGMFPNVSSVLQNVSGAVAVAALGQLHENDIINAAGLFGSTPQGIAQAIKNNVTTPEFEAWHAAAVAGRDADSVLIGAEAYMAYAVAKSLSPAQVSTRLGISESYLKAFLGAIRTPSALAYLATLN